MPTFVELCSLGWSYWRIPAVAALVIALWLCLVALPVGAVGNEIRVISDWQEARFPSHLVFHLEAESEWKIVEVRLYYRVAARAYGRTPIPWTYAYPTFIPDQRITTSLNLRTAGASYLPPGTKLEYYYFIRNVLGNVHQTARATFEYVDDRFRWQQTQMGPLTLLYHDVPPSRVDALVPEVDRELRRLASLLKIDLDQPIKGVIYNHRSEVLDAFPHQSRTITERQVFHGFAFPDQGVFVGLGMQPRLVVHESAHLLLHQALGSATVPVPAWLDEGFATYVEPGSTPYSGRSLSSRGLPLRAMSAVPGTPQDIHTFYQKAESVVAYLIGQYSVESFQEFLEQLRQGSTTNAALVRAYGFDIDGLEQQWATNSDGLLAPAPGSLAGPSPLVYLDTFVIAGLVLVVMGVFLGRYIRGRLRRSTSPDEGLQPWEDPDRRFTYVDDDYADGASGNPPPPYRR